MHRRASRRPTRHGAGSVQLGPAELPADLLQCASEVAADFGLRAAWLNAGPRELYHAGLPEGLSARLRREDFGPRLRIYWLGREDLVCLKLLAASDDRAPRQEEHEADLREMQASERELDTAMESMRGRDDYDRVQIPLKRLLIALGYENLAYYA